MANKDEAFIAALKEDEQRFHIPLGELARIALGPSNHHTQDGYEDGIRREFLRARTPDEKAAALFLHAQALLGQAS